AGGAPCWVCALLMALARHKKQIRTIRILIMPLPLSTSPSWFGVWLLNIGCAKARRGLRFRSRPEARLNPAQAGLLPDARLVIAGLQPMPRSNMEIIASASVLLRG